MLLLSILLGASAQTASAEPAQPYAPRIQATASVRILRPASLRVGHSRTLEGKPLRETLVRSSEGTLVPARLAEFE